MLLALAFACMVRLDAVSCRFDAIRTDALVQELAKQSGQTLDCDAMVAAEPVVADFSEQPLRAVTKQLAWVVGGEWVKRGEALVLTRSNAFRLQQVREEEQKIREAVQRVLDDSSKEIEALPKFTEDDARKLVDPHALGDLAQERKTELHFQNLRGSPVTRATVRLMAAIGASTLVKMEIGDRWVFSDVPTPMQRAFPAKGGAILRDMAAQARLMADTKEKVPPSTKPFTNYYETPRLGSGDAAAYRKTLLVVRRNGHLRFDCEFVALDKQGAVILRGPVSVPDRIRQFQTTLPKRGEQLDVSEEIKRCARLHSDAGYLFAMGGPGIQMPDGTKEIASFAMTFAESEGLPEDWSMGAILRDPVQHDPLGLVFGRLIRQVAQRKKAPLLASISDGSIGELSRLVTRSGIETEGQLLDYLTQEPVDAAIRMPNAEVSEVDGWLVVRPYLAKAARDWRFNRKAAKNLIAAIGKAGAPQMADVIAYVKPRGVAAAFGSVERIMISHANPGVDRTAVEYLLTSPIEFFAALTPAQWQSLTGQGLAVRQLPDSLQRVIARWVFDGASLTNPDPFEKMEVLNTEPTARFANGLPQDIPVRIRVEERPAVIARAEDGRSFALNLGALAFHEDQLRSGSAFGTQIKRKYVRYRPAVQLSYTLEVAVPGAAVNRTVIETRVTPGTEEVPLDKLPAPMLNRLEQARKAMQQRPKYQEPGSRPPPAMVAASSARH